MNFEIIVEYLQLSSITSPTAAAQGIDSLTPDEMILCEQQLTNLTRRM